MKKIFVLAASILTLAGCAQRSVNIDTPDGELVLTPLADNAVRVQVKGTLATPALEELVYLEGRRHVSFRTEKNDGFTSLQMKGMTVRYDNASATLCIEQRKTLQPYIEECARRVSEEGYTVMRPSIFPPTKAAST